MYPVPFGGVFHISAPTVAGAIPQAGKAFIAPNSGRFTVSPIRKHTVIHLNGGDSLHEVSVPEFPPGGVFQKPKLGL